jgi:hypothetical protein
VSLELSALKLSDLGRNESVLVARGEPREQIARLSLGAHVDLSLYLELRRDLFGLGSEALFVGSKGSRGRLPLPSIAQAIQTQIGEAGLGGRIIPADIGRYSAAKLACEGAGEQDAVRMIGYKRIPVALKAPIAPKTLRA